MKKLMVAAAIVCAAVATHAAVANWQLGSVYDYADISSATPSYALANGYATYFVVASEGFGVDEMKAALGEGDFSWMATQKNQTPTIPLANGAASDKTPEWFNNGDTVSAFAVIFNNSDYQKADYAYVTDLASDKIGGEGQAATISLDGTYSYLASNWTQVNNVPEPTSGLLLLLGVAGLALRRRRA